MKRLHLGLLIVWLVFVFGPIDLFGSGVEKAKEEIENIEKSKLEERNWIYYKIGSDKPFTGVGVNLFKNGQKRFEENYKNGKKHGETIWWDKNGQKLIESIQVEIRAVCDIKENIMYNTKMENETNNNFTNFSLKSEG